jgi:glycosyltransferase involved in cell wall biosynthesis
MPRRILLLITDLQIGGTPTVVRELALRLAREPDMHVQVACLDRAGPVADQLRENGVLVTPLAARSRLDARVLFRLNQLIRREQIDTVFSFLIHANAAAAATSLANPGVRFIQSIQTTQPNPRWHWILQNIIQHAAQTIVVPSPSVAEAAQNWAGIPPGKIVVIPNAVEPTQFALPRSNTPGKRVGFIGRLDPIKRIDDLITAIALLPAEVTLDIYGEGSQRSQIESQVARLNLSARIKLHGAIQRAAEALTRMDALALPSDAEGFGLVLIEAMAAGVPVIGTNVPGICDVIVEGNNGILTPPRNPKGLAHAIERILSGEELRNHLIAGGKLSVQEKYAWPIVYRQYQSLLLNHTEAAVPP